MNNIIKRIVTDHHTVVFIGIMLIIMGLISLSENLFENLFGIKFDIAYGFIMLGIFNILMALTFIIMGTKNIEAGLEESLKEDSVGILKKRIDELEQKTVALQTALEKKHDENTV